MWIYYPNFGSAVHNISFAYISFYLFFAIFFYFTWGGRCEKIFGTKKELTRRKRHKKELTGDRYVSILPFWTSTSALFFSTEIMRTQEYYQHDRCFGGPEKGRFTSELTYARFWHRLRTDWYPTKYASEHS